VAVACVVAFSVVPTCVQPEGAVEIVAVCVVCARWIRHRSPASIGGMTTVRTAELPFAVSTTPEST
jgi:hypothetical protein